MNHYIPISESASRQIIDSAAIFQEWRRVETQARPYAGGMYFKKEGPYEYLVKTLPNNRQQRLGRRSTETEQIHQSFNDQKSRLLSRLRALQDSLREAERLNKAVKAGRAPNKLIAILNAFSAGGLQPHFTVVGTHALYAYETAAAVRIVTGALATQDVDMLWDARKRVQFMTTMNTLGQSVMDVLRQAEPSFRRMEGQIETAIDNNGFQVDFLRREQIEEDPHPFRFTEHDEDLWPVQARRAAQLTSARSFEHVVISSSGRMAMLRTIDPHVFVQFKRWMAEQVDTRPALKRRRDRLQADVVAELMNEGLLLPVSGQDKGDSGPIG